VPSKENTRMRMNANIGKGSLFVVRKSKSYKNQRIDEPLDPHVFDQYKTTVVEDSAYLRNDTYWDTVRHEKLLDTEKGIYDMVDSLKRTTKFKILKYTISTLASNLIKVGPVSIGDVTT